MKKYISLMRIKHWLKNILVFLPLFFSGNIFNKGLLLRNILAFLVFCFAASIVYIINDIFDIENDKNHPIKKNRPLASGEVSIRKALCLIMILFCLLLILLIYLNNVKTNYLLYLIPISYIIINILYSKWLKYYAIIDVLTLISGFILRVMFGSLVTGITTSKYLYLMIIFGSYYLSFGKRRGEINKSSIKSRSVLSKYNKEFLDKNMYVAYALTIVSYTLWCVDPVISTNYKYIFLTIPLLITIMQLYSLNIEKDSYGDPADVILSDKTLIIAGILYIVIMCIFIYI